MRLLVDGRCLEHRQVTGVQRYAQSLVKAMGDEGYEFDIALPGSQNRWLQQLWVHTSLARQAASADALFCPANIAPVFLRRRVKLVVTLHCLRFLRYPESYHWSFRNYYKRLMPRVLERADAVITVSDAQVREIEETYTMARGKTFATHLGASSEFRAGPKSLEAERPGILYVGSLAPAKNLQLLLDVFLSLLDEIPHELWIVGAPSTALKSTQAALLEKSGGEERVRSFGQVSEAEDLAEYYRSAEFFVFPSLYESFGLPPLEAMACGTPVLVSDLPCHREVVGEAGVFFDALDPQALRSEILSFATDGAKREKLSAASLDRAAQFSWTRCAHETWKIIERTVNA